MTDESPTVFPTHRNAIIAVLMVAVTLVVGFGAVIFTYFVVNLWVSGLHSYAGV